MNKSHPIGNFLLRDELFEQVRQHLETAITIPVTDDVVRKFLADHQTVLASIVGYDEVDTTDRHNIWDACKTDIKIGALSGLLYGVLAYCLWRVTR